MGVGFSYVDQFDGKPASGFISRYISDSRVDGLTDTICLLPPKDIGGAMLAGYGF